MYMGSKHVKDFNAQTKPEATKPQEDPYLQTLQATQEGLENDKQATKHPTVIPETYSQGTKDRNTTNRASSKPTDTYETHKGI
jgi:hypothetical protein